MRALQLTAPNQWHIGDVPEPTPGQGEVVIDVAGCGMCGTDLHTLSGGNPLVIFPAIPGHEMGGTVTAVGENVSWLSVGDRVVVDPSRSCDHCEFCLSGRSNLCPGKGGYGSRYPGGFAEKAAVRAINCVKVPDGMSWEIALLAEPIACVLHGLDRLGKVPEHDAVVFGAGPIGLLVAVVLRHFGNRVSIVERSEFRRGVAVEMGFNTVVESVADLGITESPIVVDATGVPAAIEDAVNLTRRGGTMLLMGVAKQGSTITIDPHRLNWQELSIVGSSAVNLTFGRAVELVTALSEQLAPIVTHSVDLEEFQTGLDLITSQGALKVLIRPNFKG